MAPNHDDNISQLIDLISSKREYFASISKSSGSENNSHERKQMLASLGEDSRKLMFATQQPQLAFWDLVRRCSILSPIKIAQDMGVFRYLDTHTTATAKELSSMSGADKSLVVRILRPLVAEGLLDEISEETYSLNSRGSPFGVQSFEGLITFAIDFLPVVIQNPIFFKENGYKEPQSHDGFATPISSYFKKPGYGFFDYLQDHPDVQRNFVTSMKAQMQNTRLSSSAYPYSEKLASIGQDDTGETGEVAIVDVGGSKGETLLEIKASHPSIKGRMVVQDRQAVFDSMPDNPAGIELMAHDIFTEQPIKGARAYHLKRILHDWSDDESQTILKHLVDAMDKDRSRILIVDMVLPTKSATFYQAMSDHSMLTFGGKERSEKEWRELVSSVGLEIGKIYSGPEPEAVIECFKI